MFTKIDEFRKYFSRQLTAFDLTLDLLLRNNKAEVLADLVTTINGREASIKLVDIVPYILSLGVLAVKFKFRKKKLELNSMSCPQ